MTRRIKRLSKNKQARRDCLHPALAALRDVAIRAGKPMNAEILKKASLMTEDILVRVQGEPDQTKYERDTLIWMLIDITGESGSDLFNEAIAEIKKLKNIREGATHWAGNAAHFQQEANGLREQLAGKGRLIESQREALRKLRSEEWQARLLLSELVSTEACHLDHHGHCQSHGWVRSEPTCPHGRAESLLRKPHSSKNSIKENLCYCGHTAIEHGDECQRLDCACPEFVDSFEAASYLSGHHETTCQCDVCQLARQTYLKFTPQREDDD